MTVKGRGWTTRRAGLAGVGAVLALALGAGAAGAAVQPDCGQRGADRGRLLSVTQVTALTSAQVSAAVVPFFGETGRVRYAVTGYRITYVTVDAYGRPTIASGLVVLPNGGPRALQVISYDHGTDPYRGGVASVTAGDGDREAAELFASAGYAVVAPDYLGLGTGPGVHPYMDIATEASATVDMLNASRSLAARRHRTLERRLLVTGFSQGGPASMASARAIQDGQPGEYWRLAAIAPISGPYNVRTAEVPAMLAGKLDPQSAVLYIAFWTVSMNRIHHFYDNPAQVFQQPYAATVEGLFDSDHTEEQIGEALPGDYTRLLTPQYLHRLANPSGALLEAMTRNDTTCQWHPQVPVRLFGADGDHGVAFTNSQQCQAELAAHGVHADLVDVGDVGHNESAQLSVPQVLDWFSGQRSGGQS